MAASGHFKFSEAWRLSTLNDVKGLAVSTSRLAQSGFYYDEDLRSIVCYSCGLIKSRWEQSESKVALVHLALFPDCEHANFRDARNISLGGEKQYPLLQTSEDPDRKPQKSTTTKHQGVSPGKHDNRKFLSESGKNNDTSIPHEFSERVLEKLAPTNTILDDNLSSGGSAFYDAASQQCPSISKRYTSDSEEEKEASILDESLTSGESTCDDAVGQQFLFASKGNASDFQGENESLPRMGLSGKSSSEEVEQSKEIALPGTSSSIFTSPVTPSLVKVCSASPTTSQTISSPCASNQSCCLKREEKAQNTVSGSHSSSEQKWSTRFKSSERSAEDSHVEASPFKTCGTRGAVSPENKSLCARTKSFSDWPPNGKHSPQALASCGLYPQDQPTESGAFPVESRSTAGEKQMTPGGGGTCGAEQPSLSREIRSCKQSQRNLPTGIPSCLHQKWQSDAVSHTPSSQPSASQPTEPQPSASRNRTNPTSGQDRSESGTNPPEQKTQAPDLATKKKGHREKQTPLEHLQEAYQQRQRCRMCYVQRVDTIFLPCGHFCTCRSCASRLDRCCLCHAYIKATALSFF